MAHHTAISTEQCVELCIRCSQSCRETIEHCLSLGGEHAEPRHITLLEDCAGICALTAEFMKRGSAFHQDLCRVSANVCHACAGDCEHRAEGDQRMLDCARACRECAESCEAMLGAPA